MEFNLSRHNVKIVVGAGFVKNTIIDLVIVVDSIPSKIYNLNRNFLKFRNFCRIIRFFSVVYGSLIIGINY
jgi:hypothetical protein